MESAILGPLMILITAAVTDIGIASIKQMRMNEALFQAVANVVLGGGILTSATVDNIAGSLGNLLVSADSAVTVTINGDRTYTSQGLQSSSSGSAAAADTCRCPTIAAGGVVWGGAIPCSSQCADGSTPGKYALVRYTRSYTALFAQYGFIPAGGLGVQAAVRLQ